MGQEIEDDFVAEPSRELRCVDCKQVVAYTDAFVLIKSPVYCWQDAEKRWAKQMEEAGVEDARPLHKPTLVKRSILDA
jgi:hypothetical protein